MSADDGIYILVTKDSHERVVEKHFDICLDSFVNRLPTGIIAYRVALAGAIDNLGYYEQKQPYNVGYYLHQIWGNSPVFYTEREALNYASQLSDKIYDTEYGINIIFREQYQFPQ